mgnify:CR=1 FL=1
MEYTYEQALEDARFFEKNVDTCTEFTDAWLFRNSRKKKPSPYNPVVIMKDGEAVPAGLYKRNGFVKSFQISKKW